MEKETIDQESQTVLSLEGRAGLDGVIHQARELH
jgi:hypothetical protein